MINEHDVVALTTDVPEYELVVGDTGTVVGIYADTRTYEVEFMTFTGETLAVVTLPASSVRELGPHDISHVRALA